MVVGSSGGVETCGGLGLVGLAGGGGRGLVDIGLELAGRRNEYRGLGGVEHWHSGHGGIDGVVW